MYTDNRDTYRQAFHEAWHKHIQNMPLQPVERDMVNVILLHPEYQAFIANKSNQRTTFAVEENPFLHLSLHMALREQIRLDRPTGINQIYESLMSKHENTHHVEHLMMTILANLLWQAQETGDMPNEEVYLARLMELNT